MYRVLLIDDQSLFRDIARSMLEAAGDFRVVGEGRDGLEAPGLFTSLSPDLVLMDVQMPGMDGFAAARRVLQSAPGACIVLTSMHPDPEFPRLAHEAGAMAFLTKRNLDVRAIKALLDERRSSEATRKAA